MAEDGYVSLSAAMWKYMTTSLPSPSSHSIMTGFFEPNASDEQAKHYAGFGSTVVLLEPNDCNTWTNSVGNTARVEKFW